MILLQHFGCKQPDKNAHRNVSILRGDSFGYNSCVKLILPLLLLVCAPFAGLADETFVLSPSLEPEAEAVTNVPVVENTRFDIMIR